MGAMSGSDSDDPLRALARRLDEARAGEAIAHALGPFADHWPVVMVMPSLAFSLEHEARRAQSSFASAPDLRDLVGLLRWRRPLARARAEALLGGEAVDALLSEGVLAEAAEGVLRTAGVLYLTRVRGAYLFAGFADEAGSAMAYVGGDTCLLVARAAAQGRTVVPWCGAGLAALRDGAVAWDADPFARRLTALNARLNGVAVEIGEGEGPFDTLLAHPPALPMPDGVHLRGPGAGAGPDGLVQLRALLGRLARDLRGAAALTLDLFGGDDPATTAGAILLRESGLSVAVEHGAPEPVGPFAEALVHATGATQVRETYAAFTHRFPSCLVTIRRGPPGLSFGRRS